MTASSRDRSRSGSSHVSLLDESTEAAQPRRPVSLDLAKIVEADHMDLCGVEAPTAGRSTAASRRASTDSVSQRLGSPRPPLDLLLDPRLSDDLGKPSNGDTWLSTKIQSVTVDVEADKDPLNKSSAIQVVEAYTAVSSPRALWACDPNGTSLSPEDVNALDPLDLYDIDIPYGPNDFQVWSRSEQGQQRTPPTIDQGLPGLQFGFMVSDLPPSFLSEDHRYLLHHYIENLVDIFCVVRNPKSPWRMIHVRSSLQAVGELAVKGTTSHARNALLHCLLSISAYSLANKYQRSERTISQATKWSNMALRLRCKAIRHLKRSVQDLYSDFKFKYKVQLAAMLSMVTIDVGSVLQFVLSELTNALTGHFGRHKFNRPSPGWLRAIDSQHTEVQVKVLVVCSCTPSNVLLYSYYALHNTTLE